MNVVDERRVNLTQLPHSKNGRYPVPIGLH